VNEQKMNIYPGSTETLLQLCESIMCGYAVLRDIRDTLENKTYEMCSNGNCSEALNIVKRLADYYESLPNRTADDDKNLADVLAIIGGIYQYNGSYAESIVWFNSALALDNKKAGVYHSRAESYLQINDVDRAIESLQQEIALEPGNYFSILRLADLYKQLNDIGKEEECLDRLLERNPDSITALHRLIRLYEEHYPEVDVELLRRRLLAVNNTYNEIEMVIRVYHLCRENRNADALAFVNEQLANAPAMSMMYLLKAYICGITCSIDAKRSALIEFKKSCNNKVPFMDNKLEEFSIVFGEKPMLRLAKMLRLLHP
jgi:tetratricopeptide (TPR) repeat protein